MDDLSVWVWSPQSSDAARSSLALRLEDCGIETSTEPSRTQPGVIVLPGTEQDGTLFHAAPATATDRVIVVCEQPSPQPWTLLADGADDVIDLRGQDCAETIHARLQRWTAVDRILTSELVSRNLVGRSPAWTATVRDVIEVGRFSNRPVLIVGESGTGKELAARLIHTLDPREDKGRLITVDCTTIVPTLSGSELFGHTKGAFTGASTDRAGALALADGGTLLLDEIGDLPLPLQAELLRAVQEHVYKAVGADTWERTDFRLVCATHRDLRAMVETGTFRADLYHRIAAVTIELPPLRERPSDIAALVDFFLAEEFDDEAPAVDEIVRDLLMRRSYPGNVRDLRQLVARLAYRHVGRGPISVGDLPPDERPDASGPAWQDDPRLVEILRHAVLDGTPLRDVKEIVAGLTVDLALAVHEGNVRRAAERLSITQRTIQLRRARGPVDGTRVDGEPELP